MGRTRADSTVSSQSAGGTEREQELGSMYDYLAKIILLGPSGCGKSCLLHRFVKNEWRILSSQTIGVEFASKIVKVGTGSRRKRIKLQLWDTAGTERFRSVSRSYYRGAAGAILVYDIASLLSFRALPTFLNDARALASPQLTLLLAGNKADLTNDSLPADGEVDPEQMGDRPGSTSTNRGTDAFSTSIPASISSTTSRFGLGNQQKATKLDPTDASSLVPQSLVQEWASTNNVAVCVEVSALSGDGVDELFSRLARMILAKIEIGEIDPGDPSSGIQYGDSSWWGDSGSIKSGVSLGGSFDGRRRRHRRRGCC